MPPAAHTSEVVGEQVLYTCPPLPPLSSVESLSTIHVRYIHQCVLETATLMGLQRQGVDYIGRHLITGQMMRLVRIRVSARAQWRLVADD